MKTIYIIWSYEQKVVEHWSKLLTAKEKDVSFLLKEKVNITNKWCTLRSLNLNKEKKKTMV